MTAYDGDGELKDNGKISTCEGDKPAEAHGRPGMRKGRILVMDDEEMIRDVSGEMLNLLGYEAECAADGTEAIKLFMRAMEQGDPFAAVILDLTVTEVMGGLETMERLLKADPGVRAIVARGYSQGPLLGGLSPFRF